MQYGYLVDVIKHGGLFGAAGGGSLPKLLRHGSVKYELTETGISPQARTNAVTESRCQFLLAAVGRNGVPLDLAHSYFELSEFLVLGEGLFAELQRRTDPRSYLAARVPPECLRLHAFPYRYNSLTTVFDDLYRPMHEELGVDDLPGDHALAMCLCERHPYRGTIPPFFAVSACYVHPKDCEFSLDGGKPLLQFKESPRICDHAGGWHPLTRRHFEEGWVIRRRGYLMPPAALERFDTDDRAGRTPRIDLGVELEVRGLPA